MWFAHLVLVSDEFTLYLLNIHSKENSSLLFIKDSRACTNTVGYDSDSVYVCVCVYCRGGRTIECGEDTHAAGSEDQCSCQRPQWHHHGNHWHYDQGLQWYTTTLFYAVLYYPFYSFFFFFLTFYLNGLNCQKLDQGPLFDKNITFSCFITKYK